MKIRFFICIFPFRQKINAKHGYYKETNDFMKSKIFNQFSLQFMIGIDAFLKNPQFEMGNVIYNIKYQSILSASRE